MQQNIQSTLNLTTEIEKQFRENPIKIPYLFTKIETIDINSRENEPVMKMAICEKYNTSEYQCFAFHKPLIKF